ncbi:MAG: GNAT family N-acetyltransferase, partial [Candidatus Omnitrophica bacterium]|nr:GNAT family N-acetyltransferase [Candidatus Omnitrophota bacterium]
MAHIDEIIRLSKGLGERLDNIFNKIIYLDRIFYMEGKAYIGGISVAREMEKSVNQLLEFKNTFIFYGKQGWEGLSYIMLANPLLYEGRFATAKIKLDAALSDPQTYTAWHREINANSLISRAFSLRAGISFFFLEDLMLKLELKWAISGKVRETDTPAVESLFREIKNDIAAFEKINRGYHYKIDILKINMQEMLAKKEMLLRNVYAEVCMPENIRALHMAIAGALFTKDNRRFSLAEISKLGSGIDAKAVGWFRASGMMMPVQDIRDGFYYTGINIPPSLKIKSALPFKEYPLDVPEEDQRKEVAKYGEGFLLEAYFSFVNGTYQIIVSKGWMNNELSEQIRELAAGLARFARAPPNFILYCTTDPGIIRNNTALLISPFEIITHTYFASLCAGWKLEIICDLLELTLKSSSPLGKSLSAEELYEQAIFLLRDKDIAKAGKAGLELAYKDPQLAYDLYWKFIKLNDPAALEEARKGAVRLLIAYDILGMELFKALDTAWGKSASSPAGITAAPGSLTTINTGKVDIAIQEKTIRAGIARWFMQNKKGIFVIREWIFPSRPGGIADKNVYETLTRLNIPGGSENETGDCQFCIKSEEAFMGKDYLGELSIDVHVDEDFRGFGLGSALVLSALHTAFISGCSTFLVYQPRSSIYQRLGFKLQRKKDLAVFSIKDRAGELLRSFNSSGLSAVGGKDGASSPVAAAISNGQELKEHYKRYIYVLDAAGGNGGQAVVRLRYAKVGELSAEELKQAVRSLKRWKQHTYRTDHYGFIRKLESALDKGVRVKSDESLLVSRFAMSDAGEILGRMDIKIHAPIITYIQVDPLHRGRGIASELIAAGLREILDRGEEENIMLSNVQPELRRILSNFIPVVRREGRLIILEGMDGYGNLWLEQEECDSLFQHLRQRAIKRFNKARLGSSPVTQGQGSSSPLAERVIRPELDEWRVIGIHTEHLISRLVIKEGIRQIGRVKELFRQFQKIDVLETGDDLRIFDEYLDPAYQRMGWISDEGFSDHKEFFAGRHFIIFGAFINICVANAVKSIAAYKYRYGQGKVQLCLLLPLSIFSLGAEIPQNALIKLYEDILAKGLPKDFVTVNPVFDSRLPLKAQAGGLPMAQLYFITSSLPPIEGVSNLLRSSSPAGKTVSAQQQRILELIADGFRPAAIGRIFKTQAVKYHLRQAQKKLFGEINRNLPASELVEKAMQAGVLAFDENKIKRLKAREIYLPKELLALDSLAKGLDYKDIGSKLNRNIEGVWRILKNIRNKMGLQNNAPLSAVLSKAVEGGALKE